jgi:DNA repair exonuclease SbcCD ATPase subunit
MLENKKNNSMENQNSHSKLKAIIGILAVLLIGSLVYIFKLTSDAKTLQNTVVETRSEKESVLKDLSDLKATYDAAIAENTSMSDELIAERDKVVKLMADLKTAKGDAASLRKYKDQYRQLEGKMKNLMQEVEVLKTQNQQLTTNLDSTKVVLEDNKKYNQVLVGQNEELAKTVEKGQKLSITNLKTGSYKLRSSGKQIMTDKASRTDLLQVSFTIAENKIAKSGDKTYYVQVIDAKNNVLGNKETVTFGDNSLTYSFTTTVQYENKTVEVREQLKGKDFAKGTYFVNVFDKDELVSKSSFTLK